MSTNIMNKKIHLYPVTTASVSDDAAGFFGKEAAAGDWSGGEAQLNCDVWEDRDSIFVRTIVAGVKPEDLEISISNDLLTLRGEREQDYEASDDSYYCRECYFGAFSRSIVLPREVEQKKIEATIKNGILLIKLPKKYRTSAIKITQIKE